MSKTDTAPWTYEERTALVIRLAEAQNNCCVYCRFTMALPSVPETYRGTNLMTIEHIVPRSKGGTDEEDNLVAACKKCNRLRSNYNHLAFIEIMERMVVGLPMIAWHQFSVLESRKQKMRRKTVTEEVKKQICINLVYN